MFFTLHAFFHTQNRMHREEKPCKHRLIKQGVGNNKSDSRKNFYKFSSTIFTRISPFFILSSGQFSTF